MTVHEDRCDLWVSRLSELRPHERVLADVLTPAERADSGGRTDQTTGLLSRAVLRLVLARHLGVPREQLDIDRTCPTCGRPHGRPRLRPEPGAAAPSTEVSVAHGGDLLVLALARRGPVGVDVEPDRRGGAVTDELLDLALTAGERAHLESVPSGDRHRLFLRYWTGKEAVLKALGTGLDLPLHAVTFRARAVEGAAEVTAPGTAPVSFDVRHVDVGPAHVCALATGRPVTAVRVAWLSTPALLSAIHPRDRDLGGGPPPQATVSSSDSSASSP